MRAADNEAGLAIDWLRAHTLKAAATGNPGESGEVVVSKCNSVFSTRQRRTF
jgi:hypothetical protein